jgi:hypothetical protein
MPIELTVWNVALCAFAIINAAAWVAARRRLQARAALLPSNVFATRRAMLGLSAIYLLGCAFRSALPMLDVQRICLHDTLLSRIAVGRSVATIAELAFVAQWALLLREATEGQDRPVVAQAYRALLPLGVAAEIVSWLGVLTRNNLLHAIENSLWTLGAALVVVALAARLHGVDAQRRRMIAVGIAAVAGYLVFMVAVDVPMYLQRWHASGATALPISIGIAEVLRRCVPTPLVAAWREDILWLTLYFTAGVWLSIALVDAPALGVQRASQARRARIPALASNSDRGASGG